MAYTPSAPVEPAGARISRRRVIVAAALGLGGGLGLYRLLGARGGFRINTVERPTPAIDPAVYRLTVGGAVAAPVSFSLDELQRLPAVRQVSDFHCVEGWGVDNVRWQGLRMQSLIEMVKPADDAGFITFHSAGGVYKDSLTLHQASMADVLLAYTMDDQPLTAAHGYPLRLVMPRMYGYKGPKWVERIDFIKYRETGYWEERGWQIDAWIR